MTKILEYPSVTFVEFPRTNYLRFRLKEFFEKDQYFTEKVRRFLQHQRPLMKYLTTTRGIIKPFITVRLRKYDIEVFVWFLPDSVVDQPADRPAWMGMGKSTWGFYTNSHGYLHPYGRMLPNIEGLTWTACIIYDNAMEKVIRGR